jgi:hemerythrin
MSLIRWQESFFIGEPTIDADHQVIVSLLNELSDAHEDENVRDVVGSVLNALVVYISGHFEREECLMRQFHYPELLRHQEEHRRFAARVHLIQSQYLAGEHSAVDELLDFLKNWFVDHILGEDTQLRPWVDGEKSVPDSSGEFARPPRE